MRKISGRGKVILEKKYLGEKGLDTACRDFNDDVAGWRESREAKRLRKKVEDENKKSTTPGLAEALDDIRKRTLYYVVNSVFPWIL